MQVNVEKNVTVTVELDDREAKLLMCLLGSMSPSYALELITSQSMDSGIVGVDNATQREVTSLTGDLYDGLYNAVV